MEIPQSLFDSYYSAADDMIDSNFGVNCTIYYPEKRVICSNCEFNSFTGKSANIYKSGGPISFTDGFCPYCNGSGYAASQSTEVIKLRCYFDKRNWVKLPTSLNIQNSVVQTIGHIVDMPKCTRADYIIMNSDASGYENLRYRLSGEPVPHGFRRNKYFIAMWERYN